MAKKKKVTKTIEISDTEVPEEELTALAEFKEEAEVEPEVVEVPAHLPAISQADAPAGGHVKKEILLTITVTEDFKDGALATRFGALGYPVLWKKGEERSIPIQLFIRCKQSGAKFLL